MQKLSRERLLGEASSFQNHDPVCFRARRVVFQNAEQPPSNTCKTASDTEAAALTYHIAETEAADVERAVKLVRRKLTPTTDLGEYAGSSEQGRAGQSA